MNNIIVAIATPPGIGALSIVRFSGKGCPELVNSFFSSNVLNFKSHSAHFGKILDIDGSIIDEVILLTMLGQKSFTGEDSIEIICHGSILITQKILRRALAAGAVTADRGEFSRRAYLNGKIDLLQAEAIKELIHAKSERALKEASLQLSGSLSFYIKDLQKSFIDLLAIIEVHIDYPEEGIEEATKNELLSMILETINKLKKLTLTFHDGKKIFSGHTIAIIGEPNAGKSSLLNALLETDRAIVTDIAGTTRDTIEEEIAIGGHFFKFIDTAGIRKAKDKIEELGIKKSLAAKDSSDIVILLIDLSSPISSFIQKFYSEIKNCLVVYNKTDIANRSNPLHANDFIYISAKEKIGLESLKQALLEKVDFNQTDETPLLTKERHYICLCEALEALEKTLIGIKSNLSVDLISFDLREGLEKLSEVIGINVTEEILSGIFSKFCVGK